MLHDAGEEVLGGLLGAEQDKVDVLVPAKQQTFGQDSNPHHALQSSGRSHKQWREGGNVVTHFHVQNVVLMNNVN